VEQLKETLLEVKKDKKVKSERIEIQEYELTNK